jgi:hypothetical protein
MTRAKGTASALALVLGGAGFALAHPHFNKTITATLPPGVEVTVTYGTTPANELRAKEVKVGEFVVPRRPMLKLSAELKSDKQTLTAGEYTIGVIKNSDTDWTMALYPGRLGRGEAPDQAKLVKLDSMFEQSAGTADHMLLDITPGHGKFEGRAVLTLHFGRLFLAGALTSAVTQ